MQYLGDYKEDDTVYFLWSTNDADGASITRSTDGTVHVYKDNSDSTEVTTGVTDEEDFDSLTGIHACTIVLTDAFYATGADYSVVLKAATIDTQTVNAVLAHFSIENRFMRGTDSAYTGTPPTVTQIQTEMEEDGDSLLDTIRDELANGTDGLSALLTAIQAISGDASAANQTKIIQLLAGKWEIINNQLIMYDSDGTTALYTFNLTRDDEATEFNPDKRTPV